MNPIKTSSKHNARYIVSILKAHGCRKVVISPGSRNAPLILAFAADQDFSCYSVPDERSAAFTAMGMTLENHEPVAVICTSGSAAMNFYPAVAEAFYQKLPLIAITADRPLELIDQGVGQTVRQQGVYGEHVVAEANLLREPGDDLTNAYNQRIINQVMLASVNGPVHINVPFDEPLYDTVEVGGDMPRIIRQVPAKPGIPDVSGFLEVWNSSKKVLILAGHNRPDPELQDAMSALNAKSPFLVLTETVANLVLPNAICTIDRLVNTLQPEQRADLQPDLLITMGGEIVSKMVKQFLIEHPAAEHWHLSETGEIRDTFNQQSGVIAADAAAFFKALITRADNKSSDYRDYWLRQAEIRKLGHEKFMAEAPYSDLSVFQSIFNQIPANAIVHTANSASIRYAQLLDHLSSLGHFTNRGTSGIDGCTSTAIGHALCTDKPVFLITGDVAFLYDSNGFWNDRLPKNLKVIVINNGGGNIFRIIKGPEGQQEFERFQETVHDLNLKAVAELYGMTHLVADSKEVMDEVLLSFMQGQDNSGPAILEIKTPRLENSEVLLEYFQFIRHHSQTQK